MVLLRLILRDYTQPIYVVLWHIMSISHDSHDGAKAFSRIEMVNGKMYIVEGDYEKIATEIAEQAR